MRQPRRRLTTHSMTSSLSFLLAAKHTELSELQRLAQSIALARSTAALVHELQRERGLSNLWVGLVGSPHANPQAELQQQQGQRTDPQVAQWLRESVALITAPTPHAARLLGRVAYALQGLDALALLRALDTSRLQHILAAHLSSKNNTPELAKQALAQVLAQWVQLSGFFFKVCFSLPIR